MTNNEEYWKQRFIELEKSQNKENEKYINTLKEEYNKSLAKIEKDITSWYTRLANNNEISYTSAKKLLDKKELKEFKWTVEEYIKKGKENAINQKWIKELENASAKVHIEELNAIKIQIQNELEHLYDKENKGIENLLKQQYEDTYYKSIYEIQKRLNKFEKIQKINTEKIEKIISKPWTTDNQTFSNRIWKHKDELLNTLQKELTQATIRGDDIHKVTKKIAKDFEVSKGKAGRLVMTESAFFSSAGQKECFNSLNIKQYEIVATLDSHTSEICQKLDGRVFDMKDYEVGITAPPFHCWCRSVTAPYFDDEFTEGEQRIYRDEEGKSGYVDSKMSYQEWYNNYIEGFDYIIKIRDNYKGINERLSIKKAIKAIPNKYKQLLKDTQFDIITQGNSGYKANTIYILKGSNKYEVIHEIGHLIEDKLRIYNDNTFKNIINKTLNGLSTNDIIYDPETFTKGIFRIKTKKFVTEYQGRIYQSIGFTTSNNKLNYKAFKEYFSEGLRMYYEDSKLLRNRNIELYNYIKELMK